MGKTRDLFRKIRYTMGTVHAEMGTVKDRKMIMTYTEELYKKDRHDSDNHDGVITHLEPDILECEVDYGKKKTLSKRIPRLVRKLIYTMRYDWQ